MCIREVIVFERAIVISPQMTFKVSLSSLCDILFIVHIVHILYLCSNNRQVLPLSSRSFKGLLAYGVSDIYGTSYISLFMIFYKYLETNSLVDGHWPPINQTLHSGKSRRHCWGEGDNEPKLITKMITSRSIHPWDGGGIEHPSPYATAGRKRPPEGAPRDHNIVCGSSWRLTMGYPLHASARAKVYVFRIHFSISGCWRTRTHRIVVA
jgi:hypothetical protein